MKFQIISPNFHPTMAATGFAFGLLGGLLLWFFVWIDLHWVALYFGGGTLAGAVIMIIGSFYTETDEKREENYKKGQK